MNHLMDVHGLLQLSLQSCSLELTSLVGSRQSQGGTESANHWRAFCHITLTNNSDVYIERVSSALDLDWESDPSFSLEWDELLELRSCLGWDLLLAVVLQNSKVLRAAAAFLSSNAVLIISRTTIYNNMYALILSVL